MFAIGAPTPKIISREEWGAKPPVLNLKHHKITHITIHHTGVLQTPNRDFFEKLRGLQSWSQREDKLDTGKTKPQWADIPYHYYISWDGKIAECRPIELPGDTNTSYDPTGHALVVIEGLFPTDFFRYRQRQAMYDLVVWLAAKHHVPSGEIKTHMDYAPGETDCPGTSVYEEMPLLRAAVRSYLGG